jgi:hypothetical protein
LVSVETRRIESLFAVAGLFGVVSATDAYATTTIATRTADIGAAVEAPTPAITQPPGISETEYALGKRASSGLIRIYPWPDERDGPNCTSTAFFVLSG